MTESKFTTEIKSEVKEDGTESATLTIHREPNPAPDDTYWGVARQICSAHFPGTNSDSDYGKEAVKKIAAKIKRYGHYEKLSVYKRIKRYYGFMPGEQFQEMLNIKIETQKYYSKKTDEEII